MELNGGAAIVSGESSYADVGSSSALASSGSISIESSASNWGPVKAVI